MSNIVFFRQSRVDGGVRTGIDVDGSSLEFYESGSDDHDPALLWYVDLRLSGNGLPQSPEDARQWLFDHAAIVDRAFQQLAERLEVGMDADIWPLTLKVEQPAPGVILSAVCSSMRTTSARQIGGAVRDIIGNWRNYLGALPEVQHQ
jgi:hypothetical protein